MARKLDAGDFKRGDLYSFDPYRIIIKEDLRGRHCQISDQAIIDMAISMDENGQRQPVEVRVVEGKKVQLTLGFTRTNAARLLREGFEYEGKSYQDPNFLVKATVTDCNDQQSFINNIVENCHRNQTSVVDDAYNQHRLRDRYGYKDVEIAKLYKISQNKVSQLRKLLQLETHILNMVHEGMLPMNGALDLLDAPSEKRDEILAECDKTRSGKIKGSSLRGIIRSHHLNDDVNNEVQEDDDEDCDDIVIIEDSVTDTVDAEIVVGDISVEDLMNIDTENPSPVAPMAQPMEMIEPVENEEAVVEEVEPVNFAVQPIEPEASDSSVQLSKPADPPKISKPKPKKPNSKLKARSMSEIRKYLACWSDSPDEVPSELATALLDFVNGRNTEETMDNVIMAIAEKAA